MKNITKLFFAAAFLTAGMASAQSGVGVGTTTPDASSALDVTSTTKGFLMPRMTTAQRTAIATPATGLQVYDTTTNSQWFYNGTVWVQGASKADGSKFTNDAANTRVALTNLSDGTTVRTAGTEFVVTDAGKVGIGTTSPIDKLDVDGDITIGTSVSSNAVLRRKTTTGAIDIYAGTTYSNGVKIAMTGEDVAVATDAGRLQLTYGGGTAGSNGETNGTFQVWRRRSTGTTPIIYANASDNVGIGTSTPTSKLQVVGLPVHVDNAAAVTAGLTAGAFYHSGDGIVRVVY